MHWPRTKKSIEISLLESSSTSTLSISVSVAQENSRPVALFRFHKYFICLILFLHVLLALRGVKPSKFEHFITLLCIARHKYICFRVKDFGFDVGFLFKIGASWSLPSLSLLNSV
ncbi:hypothetical protein NC653_038091 [Populus alba x Populus x berolinensis]|uniref:Uncharacterized protein n=1 Tax=Populus alba x Populus x berolinensis TaxID=444605 RepID=A0AAD6LFS8_9ROSI|nr:hypothetical protein NC653_038091 [Populus alba x Populus x berolinensis]